MISQPRTVEEALDLVRRARGRGERVKAVGAGHSFTAAACTDGVLVRLDRLDEVSDVDRAAGRVTVGAGIRLAALNDRLAGLGLALPNLGDIAVQSLAGATATATHGTGVELGNLSTAIDGFELITGTGDRLWCDVQSNPELYRAGRVGLGALGIITRIRLQCVPAFNLHASEGPGSLREVLADWGGFVASADHAELFFWPGLDRCAIKRNRRTTEAPRPPSPVRRFVNEELVENALLGASMRFYRRFPSQRDRLANAFVGALSDRDYIDRSDRVFASTRRVRFTEMEYGVPLDVLPEVVERVAKLATELDEPPLMPIEVRCSAADDIPLSTAQGRATGWVAVHRYRGVPNGPYFRGVEAIMNDYDGRPHWGKLHFQDHRDLRARYPRWDEFASARAAADPDGVFRNDYLDRVLGP